MNEEQEKIMKALREDENAWLSFMDLKRKADIHQGFDGALKALVAAKKVKKEAAKSRQYYRAIREPGPLKPYLRSEPHSGSIAFFRNSEGEQLSVFEESALVIKDKEIHPARFRIMWAMGETKYFPPDQREEALAFAVDKATELGLPMGDEFPDPTPEEEERRKNPKTRRDWFERLGLGLAGPGEKISTYMKDLHNGAVLIVESGKGWRENTPCGLPEGMTAAEFSELLGIRLVGELPPADDTEEPEPTPTGGPKPKERKTPAFNPDTNPNSPANMKKRADAQPELETAVRASIRRGFPWSDHGIHLGVANVDALYFVRTDAPRAKFTFAYPKGKEVGEEHFETALACVKRAEEYITELRSR